MTPEQFELAKLDYLREVVASLNNAPHGGKGAVIKRAAKFLNVSDQEVYRQLTKVGYGVTKPRKPRSDKGTSVIDKATAQLIGGIVYQDARATGKLTTPINLALKQAQANGLAPNVSAVTISRALKRFHCHPKQLSIPSAHTTQKSLHPNHVWQVDASVCILFYLPKEDAIQNMHPREFNKNKDHNLKRIEKDRIIRYVITDHYSGSIYVEYVKGSEDAKNLIQVLLNAMQRRGNNNPMHGVPYIIYTDKGSAMTSAYFKNLLDRLQIKIIDHIAGNPRAKGQVENAQNIVERQFEGRLKRKKDEIKTIDDLNKMAWQWLAHYNHTSEHTRHGQTRNKVWSTIKPEQLRIAPPIDICQELVTGHPTRYLVNGDLTVTHTVKGFGNQTYSVKHIPDIYPRCEVLLMVNPYRVPDIDVVMTSIDGTQKTFTVSPVVKNAGGFIEDSATIGEAMRSMPDSPIDIARKEIERQAYGVKTDDEVKSAIKAKKQPYAGFDSMKDVTDATIPDFIPRAGRNLDTPQTRRELAPITVFEAAKQIKSLLESEGWDGWTADHFKALNQQYPNNQVPPEAVDTIAQAILDDAKPKSPLFRKEGSGEICEPTHLKVIGA